MLALLALLASCLLAVRYVLRPRCRKIGRAIGPHYYLTLLVVLLTSALCWLMFFLFQGMQSAAMYNLWGIYPFLGLVVVGLHALLISIGRERGQRLRAVWYHLLVMLLLFSVYYVSLSMQFGIMRISALLEHDLIKVSSLVLVLACFIPWSRLLHFLDDELPKGTLALTWAAIMGSYAVLAAGLWGVGEAAGLFAVVLKPPGAKIIFSPKGLNSSAQGVATYALN